jgi:hypothetical protein
MGNKIIIDAEVLAKLDAEIYQTELNIEKLKEDGGDVNIGLYYQHGVCNTLEYLKKLILENSTTISIDESIEERAKKYSEKNYAVSCILTTHDYIAGATEQSIISEIKSKDKEVRPFPCMNDEMCKEQCGACGYVQDKLTNK